MDEYEGCFADKKQRVMTDVLVDDDMTPVLCRSHCEDNGAQYYATQVRARVCTSGSVRECAR